MRRLLLIAVLLIAGCNASGGISDAERAWCNDNHNLVAANQTVAADGSISPSWDTACDQTFRRNQ